MILEGGVVDKGVHQFHTGMVVGVRGKTRSSGDAFEALEIIYPGFAPFKAPLQPKNGEKRLLALVSGVEYSHPDYNPVSLDMLSSFIEGYLGAGADQEKSGRIVRLMMVGNIFYPSAQDKMSENDLMLRKKSERN